MSTKEQAAKYRYNKKIAKLLKLQEEGSVELYRSGTRQLVDLHKALQQAIVAFMPFTHRLGTAAQNNLTDILEDCEGMLNAAES